MVKCCVVFYLYRLSMLVEGANGYLLGV
uniref:Uncharacterized protein n=1 Tax=Arundo donax TaxID=35708 RepID=A0A0A9AYX8_ARUDO